MQCISSRKERKDKKINEAFFKLRSYQVFQQSVLLAMLNRYFEVSIQIPTKRSVVTRQFFRIKEFRRGDDVIRVEEFVESRCREKYAFDLASGISEKTAKRRYDTNRITEQIHLMIDLLLEFGCQFSSKWTSGTKGAQIVETVKEISLGDEFISSEQITSIGTHVNDYLTHRLFDLKDSVIGMNDQSFIENLRLHDSFSG